MTLPDPDRLAQNVFAARMRQQGINRRWEQVEEYTRDYWREWVEDVRPAFEEEMRAAPVEIGDIVDECAR